MSQNNTTIDISQERSLLSFVQSIRHSHIPKTSNGKEKTAYFRQMLEMAFTTESMQPILDLCSVAQRIGEPLQGCLSYQFIAKHIRKCITAGTFDCNAMKDMFKNFAFTTPGAQDMIKLAKALEVAKPQGYKEFLIETMNSSGKTSAVAALSSVIEQLDPQGQTKGLVDKSDIAELKEQFLKLKSGSQEAREFKQYTKVLLLKVALNPTGQSWEILTACGQNVQEVFKVLQKDRLNLAVEAFRMIIEKFDLQSYFDSLVPIEQHNFGIAFMNTLWSFKSRIKESYHYPLSPTYDGLFSTPGSRQKATKEGGVNLSFLILFAKDKLNFSHSQIADMLDIFTSKFKPYYSSIDPQNKDKNYNPIDCYFKEVVPGIDRYVNREVRAQVHEMKIKYEKEMLERKLSIEKPNGQVLAQAGRKFKI